MRKETGRWIVLIGLRIWLLVTVTWFLVDLVRTLFAVTQDNEQALLLTYFGEWVSLINFIAMGAPVLVLSIISCFFSRKLADFLTYDLDTDEPRVEA